MQKIMERALKRLLDKLNNEKSRCKNAHILRFYSSYVLICDGKAVEATAFHMTHCPLAEAFYRDIKRAKSVDVLKQSILNLVNEKIAKFGHFTSQRELSRNDIAIPYGASEILMYALRKRVIDAACVVCDGAGTVIVKKPEIVQGIGARMNGIFYTSPISSIIERLKKSGSHVLFQNAGIDQAEGVKKAASLGYKNIAVTVNASMDESLKRLKEIESNSGISLTILALCTTRINKKRIWEISKYADMVWSCASKEVRTIIGKKAIVQLSRKIPVFVLSRKGLDLANAYSSEKNLIMNLNLRGQYIIARSNKGKKIKMGNFNVCLNTAKLPIRHKKEPQCV